MLSEKLIGELIELRHDLHKNAELSGNELKTSEILKKFLLEFHPTQLITGIAGHGLAAIFDSGVPGPAILLRCDIDALPIQEKNELSYQSQTPGVSHKCGHDGHSAILCGVASLLSSDAPASGNVILLFQPAEETGEGAHAVLNDPRFSSIHFDKAFGLHNLPGFPKGSIIVREGAFASASTGFIAEFSGETSHASEPEKGKNPSLAIAHLIESYSKLTSELLPSNESAILTIIHAKIGERAFGTSPGFGTLMATLRADSDELLEKMESKCRNIAENEAKVYDLQLTMKTTEYFPATVNTYLDTRLVRDVALQQKFPLIQLEKAFPWSEDFGHFLKGHEGAFFGLGSGMNCPPLHNSSYDFPDSIIESGIRMFYGLIDRTTRTE